MLVKISKKKSLVMKTHRLKSLVLTLLLFCFSLAIPLVRAEIAISQASGMELAKEARSLYTSKDYQSAVRVWQNAATIFARQEDPLNQAMALSNLSLTYQQLGEWQQSKESIESSLAVLEQQAQTPQLLNLLASSLEIQGKLQIAIGEMESALDSWQEATKIYNKIKDQNGITRSQINQAQVMQNLGLYPKACQTITKALALGIKDCEVTESALQKLTASENISMQVKGLVSLGNILRVMGKNEQSQNVLLTAEKLGATKNVNLASVYLALGNTSLSLAQENAYFARGKTARVQEIANYEQIVTQYLTDAEQYYTQTIELSNEPIARLQGKVNLLNLFIQTNRNPDNLTSEINSLLPTLPTTPEKVLTQINFTRSLLKLKKQEINTPDIVAAIDRAIAQANTLGSDRLQAFAYATLGQWYEQEQKWSEAETATKQALGYTLGYGSQDIASEVLWQLGRIEQAQDERQEAIHAYTRAYDLLQSLRGDLVATTPDTQFSFRDRIEPVYRQLVELLLSPEIEPTQAELAQARQVIESLQLAELDNFFNEACIQANPVQIDQIAPNTAVIYSILLKDRLEVIISLPDGTLLHQSTKTGDRIEQVIGDLRNTIAFDNLFANRGSVPEAARSRDENPSRGIEIIRKTSPQITEFLPPAEQLYNWLIAPFTAELERNQVNTLVFVLDGVLRNIPMAVLHDGKQYIIEKYSVVLTPGMQLLDPQPLLRAKVTTLTAGLSEQSPNFPDFAPLPNVHQELESIGDNVPTKTLLNDSFTEQNLETRIDNKPFPIVHIATHGNFSSIAEETYILAWDERINATELNQVLQGKARSNRPIELLVLSACQTALGDDRAVLGLAGVAMRGGAKSTLASLWLVNDEATALLMEKFYQELAKSNVSKAEALRRAQVAILKSERFNDPYFWSAFVLVGNWL
ncbi:MAG: CHAT domain-containing protein [Xenococcaceae cyanobacterium MO_188.B32]|nr:CHAT domain-containing protein [Xenococcaceae cyanobacterium MO_188.B32]